MDVVRVLILIVALLGYYVVPVTLALGAFIRLVSGLHGHRAGMALALLLALPQTAAVTLFENAERVRAIGQIGVYALPAIALPGLVLWARASWSHRPRHYWIEPLLAVAVVIGFILSIDNWIAH
ncbi:MAG: hypothetical protein ACE5DK_04145 [Paracoccaceae bacterium]